MRGGRPSIYTPKEAQAAKQLIALFARNAGVRVHPGPVRLSCVFGMGMTTTAKRTAKHYANEWGGYESTIQPHMKRPDGDNLLKLVADSLIGIAYDDDAAVFDFSARKIYSEKPFTRVEIEWIDDDQSGATHGL